MAANRAFTFPLPPGDAPADALRWRFSSLPFIAVTENDPILAELAAKLAEAETFAEESRERLGRLFGEIREGFALMAALPDIPPEERTRQREQMRAHWLNVFEQCRNFETATESMLQAGANLADDTRNLTITVARTVHEIRTLIETGKFKGTWEQREQFLGYVREFEENKESFLEELSAEDIRQLRDEGVL